MTRSKVVPTWVLMGFTLGIVWLFVRGIGWIGNPINIVEELIIGFGVGMPIAYATRRMYDEELPFSDPVRTPLYSAVYLGFFLWELLTANLDVAYRVIRPSMPIHPDVVEVPLRVEQDLAITTIANSITLTPGTLTMDYDPDRNALYVHAIDARNRQEIVDPIRRWEDYALVIFDERRSPGDPVPDPERVAQQDDDRETNADHATTGGDGDGD